MPGHGFSPPPGLLSRRSDVDAALANTASISELFASVYATQTESNQQNDFVFVAPFPLVVKSCAMMFAAAATGDATNRWRFDLNRVRSNVFNTIASRSNWGGDAAGGASIQPNIEWNFDGIVFNAGNASLVKGDAVAVTHVPVGAPATFGRRVITVRYEPL